MKNLQRLLIAATFASIIMPSAGLLCSEKPAKTTEMNILMKVAHLGGVGVLAGAHASNSLKKVKQTLINTCEHNAFSLNEEAIMAQLNKGIKNNKMLMGVSFVATLAPVIIPTAVDKLNAINKPIKTEQNINKELTKETV